MSVKSNIGVVTDGLVFYVDAGNDLSYLGSGGTWSDLIRDKDGSFNNMDDINNPSNNYNSANGGFIQFDGVNEYVLTTFSDIYTYMGAFTISYWIKTTSTALGAIFGLSSGDTGAPNFYSEAFSVVTNRSTTGSVSGYTRLFLRDEGPFGNGSSLNTFQASWNDAINDGNWHHVSISYNNLSTPVATVYKDGVSLTITYLPADRDQINLSYVNNPAERDPAIGAAYGRDDLANAFFTADIAALSFYDRVLTSSEVAQNYNALKNRFV
jgi:hypothetical protein